MVAEGKASVEKETIKAVIEKIEEGEAVILPVAQVTEEVVEVAEVNAEAFEAIAEAQADVVVEFTDVTVKIDAVTVKAIAEQANHKKIEIRAVSTEISKLTDAQQATLENKEAAVVVIAIIIFRKKMNNK